jgi:uncharacterized protein (DUF362 family)
MGSRVALARTGDRLGGVQSVLRALESNPVVGKNVLVKPNFNTADATPGSTHNDTLIALVDELWRMGAKTIAVGERSYPPTREVMESKGILPLLAQRDVQVLDFDELPEKDWILQTPPPDRSHWENGFRIARPVMEAECLVSTCCLKTHQHGGVFTLSLKLHVGVVPTARNGFPYMRELHGSPHQQEMIAEINAPFAPDLVVLDGVEAFVDGGPATGSRARAEIFLAAADRVATDAVGVAVLRELGSNAAIMETPIFDQRQIRRAAELGLGVSGADQIELVPVDDESKSYCETVGGILAKG